MKGTASLTVALTDLQVGGRVLSIKTQPLTVKGGRRHGREEGGGRRGAWRGHRRHCRRW